MNYFEQKQLYKTLEKLKKQDDFPNELWSDMVEEGIRTACSSESKFYKEVVELRHKTGIEVNDKRIKLLKAAQAMLEIGVIKHPDSGIESEVRVAFNDYFFHSWPIKINMIFSMLLIVTMFGGTVFFGSKIVGFNDRNKDALKNLESAEKKALSDISVLAEDLRNDAMKVLSDKIAIEKFENDIAEAKRSAINSIEIALKGEGGQSGALTEINGKKNEVLDTIQDIKGSKDDPNSTLGEIEKEKQNALNSIEEALGDSKVGGALYEIERTKINVINVLKEEKGNILDKWDALTPKTVGLFIDFPVWIIVSVFALSIISFGFSIVAILKKN